ncbi:hypothetical protein SLEP1_g35332 [Rubroshorea leprosula]|uniref:Disease resistance protein At4g27190-like leucine-rich repeats domain-containing protein n=1 Tax=Rubroshorea leprosula TaxID=152421 RepID=A0AAV5KMY9_9ROSI|nr:hypothetical protein SLEP1_g35332 [Rubroshorea leprosula]
MLEHLEIGGCKKMGKVLLTENVEENGNLIFPQLRILEIQGLPKLERFCHGNYIKFPCLSQLLIMSCPVLKTFISSSSSFDTGILPLFDAKVTFPELEQLTIEFMEGLDKIWDYLLDTSSFCQLNYLSVNSCNKLLNIFPFSMLERLQRLDKLEIRSCNSLEEIFESQGLDAGQSQTQKFMPPTLMESCAKLVFPKLTQLDLYFLRKLRALCHQVHATEWPSLKRLTVLGCEKLQIFASELSSFPRTNGDDQLEVPFFWTSKATFPCLEELELNKNDIMKEIWHGQYPGDYFPKLKVLKLIQLPEQSVVHPFLFQSPNLERLVVSEASFLELFQCQGLGDKAKPALALTESSELRLSELLESVFYNLKTLEVLQCSNLKNLVPSFVSFKNLTTLEVSACHELINLIEYSTAKSMVQLTKMSISKCQMLKEIVACVGEEVMDGIAFSQLKYLLLRGLPRLASFCSRNCGFELASLEEVIVMGCPNMQIFSRGECSTTNKLQKVKLTLDEDEGFWEGNLNSTIKRMFTEKAGCYGLEDLKLSEFPELIEIWYMKPQENLPFKRLKFLEVCNCSNLTYLLNPSMALGLVQLDALKVTNCAMMEQVITGEGAEEMFPLLNSILLESCSILTCFYEGSTRLKFSSLKQITVAYCPNLLTFASSFSREQGTEMTANGKGSEQRPETSIQPFFSEEVVLPCLEELQLRWMNVNIKWHTSITYLCVEKLKKLIIQGCDNLEYLFSSSVARGLVMLNRVEIRECKRMREIIVTENAEEKEDLIFPQLNFLLLKDLQNIVGFYSGNCIVEFPSLRQLQVLNCPKLEGFIVKHFASTNVIADKQPLFNEQVAFPNLESLTLTHLKNLDIIWHNQFHADSFGKLKSLMVSDCEKLSTIFPSVDMLGRIWKSLEELIISDCGSLEVVFGIAEFNVKQTHAIIDTKLRELNIDGLPRLKYVWNKDPQGILTFHSLELVVIERCDRLKFLFPASIGKSLSQLQKLHLAKCGVEEIVTMGEQGIEAIVNFEFPRLSSLKLGWLPRLQCFHPGKHTAAWPKLKKFHFSLFNQVKRTDGSWQLDFPVRLPLFSIEKCPKLMIFNEGDLNTPLLQRVELIEGEDNWRWEGDLNTTIQRMYMEEVGFAGLQLLMLSTFPKLLETWHIKNPQELLDFRQLRVLEICDCSKFRKLCVEGCGNLEYLLTSSMVKSFEQLNWLKICDCNMMEEVILVEESMDEEKMCKTFFPNLEFLLLQDLSKLTRFCFGNHLELPCLWKLKISKCPVLKTFISSPFFGDMIASSENVKNTCALSLFDAKVAFPKLEHLVIEHVKSLNKIWKDQLVVDSFCQLTLVSVVSCEKLLNIFPFSMLERLQRLDKLQIWNCDSLEEILESNDPAVSQSQTRKATPLPLLETATCLEDDVKDEIVFSKLKYLQLCGLPRLSSFCLVKCKFEFPFLEDVILMDCPSMQTFSMDEIRTPKLQKVKLTRDEDEGFWDGNLNSTIQLQFMQKSQGDSEIEIKEIAAHVLSK